LDGLRCEPQDRTSDNPKLLFRAVDVAARFLFTPAVFAGFASLRAPD
jgi:hypothetical protein